MSTPIATPFGEQNEIEHRELKLRQYYLTTMRVPFATTVNTGKAYESKSTKNWRGR